MPRKQNEEENSDVQFIHITDPSKTLTHRTRRVSQKRKVKSENENSDKSHNECDNDIQSTDH